MSSVNDYLYLFICNVMEWGIGPTNSRLQMASLHKLSNKASSSCDHSAQNEKKKKKEKRKKGEKDFVFCL